MLKSLKIENFRGFQSFELQQLGRINLLVGENNSGKTSILEAIQIFYSRANLDLLSQTMTNRGEMLWNEDQKSVPVSRERELDIRHLFYSHEISLDSKFLILGSDDNFQDSVSASVSIHELDNNEQADLFDLTAENEDLRGLDFNIIWNLSGEHEGFRLPLSPNGGLPINYARRIRRSLKNSTIRTRFVPLSSLTIDEMIELFDQVVLQPEEEVIVQALQILDPAIARIASVGGGAERYRSGMKGGFVVRRSDNDQRLPIGSMGDGIWRMLGLSLAAVRTKGGVLLVDEVDTGLHFTTMVKMWRMLWETAKQSNVQIFATTHSRDCWESLAELVEAEKVDEDEITIHRIERQKPNSAVFDAEMIVIAANQGIEVR
ncbi:MAG: chromosome segregation protein SMC [Leptolyngbya sp.]|nr:MAG: chromosome segregation protein SMC [Leptolyngbya sp.]